MNEIASAADDLRADLSSLRERWQMAATCWRDATAIRFQRDYWAPCETEVVRMIQAIQELDESLRRVSETA
jgi:hypothetical protein